MRQWEYRKIALSEAPRGSDDVDLLCQAGEDGWELVAILPNGIAYLKRELIASVADMAEEKSERIRQLESERRADLDGETPSHVKPKYRDVVTGETWSGRGRMASWLKRKQDAGEDIDKYLV